MQTCKVAINKKVLFCFFLKILFIYLRQTKREHSWQGGSEGEEKAEHGVQRRARGDVTRIMEVTVKYEEVERFRTKELFKKREKDSRSKNRQRLVSD